MSAALVLGAAAMGHSASAAIVEGDSLELAVRPPVDAVVPLDEGIGVFASNQYTYDDNIYRLPAGADLTGLNGIGANASRSDHIDVWSAGLDGRWSVGRQLVGLDLRADDNRYAANDNLNNVSTRDKVLWNWGLGSALSGQVGGSYSRGQISFVNAATYGRDIFTSYNYFGAGRWQVGPHWGVYAGIIENVSTLSDPLLSNNDNRSKSVAIGTDLATSRQDSIGAEYRYTDTRFPDGLGSSNDFREDAARVVVKRIITDKTVFEGDVGFLKRDYAFTDIRDFSGVVWKAAFRWQPDDKFQVAVDAERNLQAYVTAESDYYVSNGIRVTPGWIPSEKVRVNAGLSYERQNYVGNSVLGNSDAGRRDNVTGANATVVYTPFRFLEVDFLYTHEKRSTNQPNFAFDDNTYSIRVAFQRLP